MRILVDADACPVVRITEQTAREHGIPVTLLCDTNHILSSDYSEIKVVDHGRDSVDLALINLCASRDIVVTQDYGVAALALGKGAYAIQQSGHIYRDGNIEGLLQDRWAGQKARRSHEKVHLKGPKKRTPEDDEHFRRALEDLIKEAL